MSNRIIISVLMCIISVLQVGASNIFQQADSAYNTRNYKLAISLYEQCLKQGEISDAIYYNLGNAYFKIDDFGKAVINFKRALKENPSNEASRNNLIYLRSKINDQNVAELKGKKGNVSPEEPSFLENIYNSIAKDTHSDSWAVWSAVSFLLLIISIAAYIFLQNVLLRKIGFFGGLLFLIVSIVTLLFSFMAASEYDDKDRAVVTSFSVQLKSEAKENAESVSIPFHRGTEFDILEKFEDVNNDIWFKVRINEENAGWVKINDIEII